MHTSYVDMKATSWASSSPLSPHALYTFYLHLFWEYFTFPARHLKVQIILKVIHLTTAPLVAAKSSNATLETIFVIKLNQTIKWSLNEDILSLSKQCKRGQCVVQNNPGKAIVFNQFKIYNCVHKTLNMVSFLPFLLLNHFSLYIQVVARHIWPKMTDFVISYTVLAVKGYIRTKCITEISFYVTYWRFQKPYTCCFHRAMDLPRFHNTVFRNFLSINCQVVVPKRGKFPFC